MKEGMGKLAAADEGSGRWAGAMAIVKDFEEKCGTPDIRLKQVADAMAVEMHAGREQAEYAH